LVNLSGDRFEAHLRHVPAQAFSVGVSIAAVIITQINWMMIFRTAVQQLREALHFLLW
jgi:hypothetical protein